MFDVKQYQKEYRIKNKEVLFEKSKEYYIKNRKVISKKKHEHYVNNREQILQYEKEYWEKNKNKLLPLHKISAEKYRIKNREILNYKSREYIKNIRIAVMFEYSNGRMCCNFCGKEGLEFLTIDHMNNDGAKHKKTFTMKLYSWLLQNNFPEGFQVLCWNCNSVKYIHGEERLKELINSERKIFKTIQIGDCYAVGDEVSNVIER